MRRYLAAMLGLVVLVSSSCALHTRTKPLEVGDKAPDFALPDADGRVWTLKELVGNGPLVLVFYRGYW